MLLQQICSYDVIGRWFDHYFVRVLYEMCILANDLWTSILYTNKETIPQWFWGLKTIKISTLDKSFSVFIIKNTTPKIISYTILFWGMRKLLIMFSTSSRSLTLCSLLMCLLEKPCLRIIYQWQPLFFLICFIFSLWYLTPAVDIYLFSFSVSPS